MKNIFEFVITLMFALTALMFFKMGSMLLGMIVLVLYKLHMIDLNTRAKKG